ncbi:MAG TPA: hypothetical protein VLD86_04545 [Ilumatobacteraceae bacterium]|nr:hypothetical protein [Ilumatobacteraceae bacterium]
MKRSVALLALAAAAATLTSCATFNRNNVAARAGHNELTQKAVKALVEGTDPAQTGPQIRAELTSWIKVASVAESKGLTVDGFEQQTRSEYEKGLSGTAGLCLEAIIVANIEATRPVVAALQSGTSFADAFTQYNQAAGLAQTGGLLLGPDGSECVGTSTVPANVLDVLKTGAVGQPIAADFGSFSAVLIMRPFDDLSQTTRAQLEISNLSELELAEALKDAGVWVDSRYGAWNPLSQAVEPLRS